MSYDSSGNHLWQHFFDTYAVIGDTPRGIVFDNLDNIYVGGASYEQDEGSNIAVFKLNPGGGRTWIRPGMELDPAGTGYLKWSVIPRTISSPAGIPSARAGPSMP